MDPWKFISPILFDVEKSAEFSGEINFQIREKMVQIYSQRVLFVHGRLYSQSNTTWNAT